MLTASWIKYAGIQSHEQFCKNKKGHICGFINIEFSPAMMPVLS